MRAAREALVQAEVLSAPGVPTRSSRRPSSSRDLPSGLAGTRDAEPSYMAPTASMRGTPLQTFEDPCAAQLPEWAAPRAVC